MIQDIWKENHKDDHPSTKYDPENEEPLSEESLEQLSMFANGE